ncbi:hypothetical protein [Flavobacterium sp.]|uniref:hypothetical protein n=1 Tax=Flavobacterium sp. TaxID=239 RepID=UPI003C3E3501
MKSIPLIIFIIVVSHSITFSQSIFKNEITDTNSSLTNPYTNGQIIDPNISVSGVGRGPGLNGNTGINRYNARDWSTSTLDVNDYFEFIITPKPGFAIDFINLTYKAQISLIAGPIYFTFRSSVDAFTADIATPIILNAGFETSPPSISLSSLAFQNINSAIHFRLYAWGGSLTTGTLSINEFAFNGVVKCNLPIPIIANITHPNCTNPNATIELLNLPINETWDLYQNDVLIQSGGSGGTTTITGLHSGDYHYKVGNPYCKSESSIIVNIIENSTTWNGTAWSNGDTSSDKIIIFDGNYESTISIEACSCKIKSGTVRFLPNHNLKLTNEINVIGGSITFENNASLIQLNDNAINAGNINYQRQTTPISNLDYTYWSSPVTEFTIGAVSPYTLSGKWYSFNTSSNNWKQETSASIMITGKGYSIRGPESNKFPNYPSTYLANFIGVPNNGTVKIPIHEVEISNLIGNPYPCAINADRFITENSSVIDGTLYFWTHNTAIQKATNITNGTAGTGTYAYTSDDYASYNLTGGVAAVQTPMISGGLNTNIPTGEIAACQGFFVTSNKTGTVSFKNSMKLDSGGIVINNSQFYKPSKFSKTTTKNLLEKNRVWLNLTNDKGIFKQILVGYITGATNGWDSNYDGQNFNKNQFVNFYSINNNINLSIQGRRLPFVETDEVPLGYSTTIISDFLISIDTIDGVLKNQKIYLEDKDLDIIHDLSLKPYAFSSNKGIFDHRFVLLFSNKKEQKLKITTQSMNKKDDLFVFLENKNITVNAVDKLIDKIIIHSFLGKKIYQKENVNRKAYVISDIKLSQGILLVTTILKDQTMTTRKIIY